MRCGFFLALLFSGQLTSASDMGLSPAVETLQLSATVVEEARLDRNNQLAKWGIDDREAHEVEEATAIVVAMEKAARHERWVNHELVHAPVVTKPSLGLLILARKWCSIVFRARYNCMCAQGGACGCCNRSR